MAKLVLVYSLVFIFSLATSQSFHDVHEKNVREVKKPFRMAKINLIWEKAVQQEQLSDKKLLVLMSELKVQDKQELTLKKHKAEGGDKEGQMEAQLRKSLRDITNRYRLGRPSDDATDGSQSSSGANQAGFNALFKDKKLNKLWAKAEMSGFTQEELKALQEEFQHHQEKIDQYYDLLQANKDIPTGNNELNSDVHKFDHLSSMEEEEDNNVLLPDAAGVNTIREKHRNLKDGYDRLHKLSSSGADSKEFLEPKVAGLWKLAAAADFTQEELESLHTELKHYENRLLKVRHLTGELLRLRKTGGSENDHPETDTHLEQKLTEVSPSEGDRLMQERVTKQRRTVDKLHQDLEMRILQRHSEL